METKNNGGPAFPGSQFTNDSDVNLTAPNGQVVAPGDWIELPGMSLRDYFAAKALAAFIGNTPFDTVIDMKHVTEGAYKMADHMLRARD